MVKIVLTLIASLAFIAAAHADPKGKRIALLQSTAAHPYNASVFQVATKRGKDFGMEFVQFSANFNPATQAQQVDDAIARKFDVIAITAVSDTALVPALSRAKAANIPVILMTAPIAEQYSDLYLSFLGEDPYALGHIAGEAVIKALKDTQQDGGKVAVLAGSMVQGVAPIRATAFKDAIKANPKIELVAVEDGKWDTATSEKLAGQLYARFAGQGGLAAIYGMADNQAMAAIQAADAAGIPVGVGKGKLIVVGSNCLGNSVQLVKDGKMYSSATQWPERTGIAAAELIADLFNGKAPPKRKLLPVYMITRDNADQWLKPCTY